MKKAFTLSEMLVCLAVMAAIIALFLSAMRAKPNSNMVMFRKAYNITSNTVYEMLQTAAYYEDGLLSNLAGTSQKVEGKTPSGNKKFCEVFASYLNTGGAVECKKGANPSFSTLDGIDWYLPPKTTTGKFTNKETIRVDVNGTATPPNCKPGDDGCKNPDVFEIQISNVGKISIDNEIARNYLQNTRNISR